MARRKTKDEKNIEPWLVRAFFMIVYGILAIYFRSDITRGIETIFGAGIWDDNFASIMVSMIIVSIITALALITAYETPVGKEVRKRI